MPICVWPANLSGATMVSRSFSASCAPVVIASDPDGQRAIVLCDGCGHADEWRINSRLPPPDIIHKHFTRKGWRLGRKVSCAECQKRREIPVTKSPSPQKTEPTNAARKAKQLVFLALMDYYDEARKAYKAGHSARTIAETASVSEEFVKKVREADFGPLAVPDDVQALRNELRAVHQRIEELSAEKLAIHAKFDRLCQRNGWITE